MKSSAYNMFVPCMKGFAVFNALTGSILFVDEEMKETIENGNLDRLSREDVEALQKVGVVVADDVDENLVLSYRLKHVIYSSQRATFSVLPTYACNLACPYCYEGRGELHRGTMTEEMVTKVINGIKAYCTHTGVHHLGLTLYGGEPLLHKNASLQLVSSLGQWAKATKTGYMCSMITNGTLVTEEVLSEFDPFLKMIQVTLDGPEEYHDARRVRKNGEGTYHSIMGAIGAARKKGILVMIRIQVAKDNVAVLDALFEDLAERGFAADNGIRAYAFPLMDINEVCSSYASLCSEEETKMLPSLWRKAREYEIDLFSKPVQVFISPYCSFASRNSFLVDAVGDVYKCVSVVGEKACRVARMTETGLTDITPELYAFTVRDPLEIEKCTTCRLLPLCGGGCAYRAFQKHGSYQAGDCTLHKGLEEEKLKLYLEKTYPDRFR